MSCFVLLVDFFCLFGVFFKVQFFFFLGGGQGRRIFGIVVNNSFELSSEFRFASGTALCNWQSALPELQKDNTEKTIMNKALSKHCQIQTKKASTKSYLKCLTS